MDSEVQRDGRILDLIDDAWREDKLPYEDVAIPLVGSLVRGLGPGALAEVELVRQRNQSCRSTEQKPQRASRLFI